MYGLWAMGGDVPLGKISESAYTDAITSSGKEVRLDMDRL